jgi:hypothetical protein
MWEMSKPIEIISFMCGIEIPVLRMLAVGLEWKRIKREWWQVRWFGPFLTVEEMKQCSESDFSSENYEIAPDDNEGIYKNKYTVRSSAASTLSWIDESYK